MHQKVKDFVFLFMLLSLHYFVKETILKTVDFFYPIFRKFMPLQTYRYAACGGSNTALNILIYFISYNFVLKKQIVHLPFIAISPHIAAFLIAFFITMPIGFYLNMFVVFKGSYLRRRIQFIRYFMVVMACVVLNYLFLKLFVEQFGWYPTPSAILTTVIIIGFSYLSQRYFSFRVRK
ncbi:GtrA-like protein [Pedobacter glucosidilyticus]|nr:MULTISPECIES: GtrA family protein [Pedobacter]KHJ39682.1 GtrA-like protein [Pedobacter glucosidilyticus]